MKIRTDLALIDIGLANNGSGWDLLKHLRAKDGAERIPIVMLTGSDATLDRERSLRMGADRYLIKPVRPNAASRRQRNALRTRRHLVEPHAAPG